MTGSTRCLALVVSATAAVVAAAVPGGLERGQARTADAPSWSAPCWTQPPRRDRVLQVRCVRVKGRVIWVRRSGFQATSEAHLIVLSSLRIVLVKLTSWPRHDVPAIGEFVTIVGPLVTSRSGLPEVQYVAGG